MTTQLTGFVLLGNGDSTLRTTQAAQLRGLTIQ
jgi:hypothetical protein